MTGPLADITVLELGGIGPLPLLAMTLADLGARVVRVDPVHANVPRVSPTFWIYRGRESLTVDLRQPQGRDVLLQLVEHADVLLEGYRPGVVERLGIGPEVCRARNPRLIYGRMTGWGSSGPLADKAGHDLNYISITGALGAMGPAGSPPTVPLNLIGDYGGGAMMLALGVLAALAETRVSGEGQVVEAAMSDGTLTLMAQWYAMRDAGRWVDEREANVIDGGAPFYRCYETSDGRYVAVGAVGNKFYADLIDGLELHPSLVGCQNERARWPELRELFAATFKTRSRAEWEQVFAERDACVTPVLSMAEAPEYAHNAARDAFVEVDGQLQVAPPVRFGRTPAVARNSAPAPGADNTRILEECGIDHGEIDSLRASGVIG